MNTFYHSGGLGDIIYSLPTVKRLGGGIYVTGLPMNAHDVIAPLLLSQPYITGVRHVTEDGLPKGYINLDYFRHSSRGNKNHLVNQHLRYFGFDDYDFETEGGWLEGIESKHIGRSLFSVLNITPRYRDKIFSWRRYFNTHPVRKLLFMGLPEEYHTFGWPITNRYFPVGDYLEAARIIAGAEEFYGNQSSLLAIRQGLGMTYHMEWSPNHVDSSQFSTREIIVNRYTRKIHKLYVTVRGLFKSNI